MRSGRSDLKQCFGTPKNPPLVHVRENNTKPLQGFDSALVKFTKNICARCNNEFTQPFDRSYEKFIKWIIQHRDDVIRRRVIDFELVYLSNWEDEQRNLFKYFAKCFGCRLDEASCEVPVEVVSLLGLDNFETCLYVTFYVNEDQFLLPEEDQPIGTYGLAEHRDKNTGKIVGYQCGHFFKWFSIMYWYNYFPLAPIGAPWVANSKYIYLGWDIPLSNNSDFIEQKESI